MATSPDEPAPAPEGPGPTSRHLTVYGRQGSPTVTVGLPFSRIEVSEAGPALAAVEELAGMVQRLAEAAASVATAADRPEGAARLDAVAGDAAGLVERLRSG